MIDDKQAPGIQIEEPTVGNVVSVGDHGIYPFVMIVQFKDEQSVRDAIQSGLVKLTMFEPAVRRPYLVVDDNES